MGHTKTAVKLQGAPPKLTGTEFRILISPSAAGELCCTEDKMSHMFREAQLPGGLSSCVQASQ